MITKGLAVITTQGFGNRLKISASSKILAIILIFHCLYVGMIQLTAVLN